MNQTQAGITQMAYQELINQGNQQLQVDIQEAIRYYVKAMDLIEDKYQTHILQAKAHMSNNDEPNTMNAVTSALNYTNNKTDRLQEIGKKKENDNQIPTYVHGLIKEIDPEYNYATSQTYDDYYQLINEFVYYGQFKYAQTNLFEKLIQLSECKKDTLIHCGYLAINANNQEISEEYFQRALQLQEEKQDVLIKIGEIYLSKNPQKAVEYFESAISLNPEMLEPHLKIVQVKLSQGLFQESQEYINKQKIPNESQAYIDLGILFNKQETKQLATAYLTKAIDLLKDKLQTLVQIAKISEYKDDEFIKVVHQRISNEGDDLKVLLDFTSELYCSGNRTQELVDMLRKVLLLDPEQGYSLTYLAETLISLGRRDEAIQELVRGIEVCPHFSPSQYLGELLLEDNKPQDALKYFKIVIENDLPRAFLETIKFLYQKNAYNQCIECCDEYQKHSPYEGHFYKASSLFKLARIEEAVKVVNQGAETCEERQMVWFGQLLLENKCLEQGLVLFKKVTKSQECNLNLIYDEIVNALFDNHYFQESLEFCEQFIEYDQTNDKPHQFKGIFGENQAKILTAFKKFNEAIPILEQLRLSENSFTVMEAEQLIQKIQELETQQKVQIDQQEQLE